MTTQEIKQKIKHFTQERAGYESFLKLVAQPLIFSADLLYKIWLNFRAYEEKNPAKQASYLVVSDLILSSLCRPIGANQFILDTGVKNYLQKQLPTNTQTELATFVAEYTAQRRSKLPQNIYVVYKFWAVGILNPRKMEEEIIAELKEDKSKVSDSQKMGYLSLYFKILGDKQDKGTNQAHINLKFAEKHETQNVIEAFLPEDILKNIGKEEVKSTHLNLSNQNLSDISFLQNRTDLTSLDLSNNQISDISILKNLKNLQVLDLSNNQITVIPNDLLENPPYLKELYLKNNPITNVPKEFFFEGQNAAVAIHDYFIKTKYNISSPYLVVLNSKHENLSFNDAEFEYIIFDNMVCENLSISKAKSLKSVLIRNCKIGNLSLSNIESNKLTILIETSKIGNTALINLSSVESVTVKNSSLESFLLDYLHSEKLMLIFNAVNIKSFSVYQTKNLVFDIYPGSMRQEDRFWIAEFGSGFESISLTNCALNDISFLSKLKTLQKLNLSDNNISDLSPLSGLENLKSLDISFNSNINDFSFLSRLINITDFSCGGNGLKDISNKPKKKYNFGYAKNYFK